MSEPTFRSRSLLRPADGPATRITVSPALDRSEVAFLAGFAAVPVRDHSGEVVVARGPARVWPGQPRSVAPVCPCSSGCCLVATPGRGGLEPGLAAQWLRFLVATFLSARHRVGGGVVVPVRGGGSEVVLVDGGDVFEGVLDPAAPPPGHPPGGPVGGWPA
jgi:hypothetical protein